MHQTFIGGHVAEAPTPKHGEPSQTLRGWPPPRWSPQTRQPAQAPPSSASPSSPSLAAYAIGRWYFSSHFTPGTTVDGVDASLMTTDQLADAIQDRAASYEQHITSETASTTPSPRDIGLSTRARQVATEALERTNPVLWLPYLHLAQHMLIDAHIQATRRRCPPSSTTPWTAYNKEAEQPTNATGTYDEEQDAFVVAPRPSAPPSTHQAVTEKVETAFRELTQDVTLDESALQAHEHTRQDETLARHHRAGQQDRSPRDLDVMCDGQTVATIDATPSPAGSASPTSSELDIDGVYDWVEDNEAINDAGNATDDEHVWALDSQATCDDIHRAWRRTGTDAQVKRTAIETKPPATPGAKERGRHLDVNLSTQFVRFYDEDGKVIWDSYCVTGGWDSEYQEMHATPQGTYHIQAKDTNTTLVGADRNDDKKPDYESFVYYWMPFLNYDYGFHDATWRSDFGGDIRYWWGSHGCINLPFEKAEELFNLVKVGDTVYIHD